jgi:hypothetical protein
MLTDFGDMFNVDDEAIAASKTQDDAIFASHDTGDQSPEAPVASSPVSSLGDKAEASSVDSAPTAGVPEDDLAASMESIGSILSGYDLTEKPSSAKTPAAAEKKTTAKQKPAVTDEVSDFLSEGEREGASDLGAGFAISALAQTSGFKDEREFRERLRDIEQGVGEVSDVQAGINVDLAVKTMEEAIEEYPDKPLPPPASAESVLTLLEQLVDNYESRSESIDGDEKESN